MVVRTGVKMVCLGFIPETTHGAVAGVLESLPTQKSRSEANLTQTQSPLLCLRNFGFTLT